MLGKQRLFSPQDSFGSVASDTAIRSQGLQTSHPAELLHGSDNPCGGGVSFADAQASKELAFTDSEEEWEDDDDSEDEDELELDQEDLEEEKEGRERRRRAKEDMDFLQSSTSAISAFAVGNCVPTAASFFIVFLAFCPKLSWLLRRV